MRMGPIGAGRQHGQWVLTIPLILQGEFAVTKHDDIDLLDGAEARLSTKAGRIGTAIEDYLIETNQYFPEDEGRFDSPVHIEGTKDENATYIRIDCSDEAQAKAITEHIKINPVIMSDIELVEPRRVKPTDLTP